MVPVVLGRLDTYKSLQNVLRSALDEHESLRGVMDVSDDMYRRTHVNLQSLLLSAECYEAHHQSRMRSIETCLSVVSLALSARQGKPFG